MHITAYHDILSAHHVITSRENDPVLLIASAQRNNFLSQLIDGKLQSSLMPPGLAEAPESRGAQNAESC